MNHVFYSKFSHEKNTLWTTTNSDFVASLKLIPHFCSTAAEEEFCILFWSFLPGKVFKRGNQMKTSMEELLQARDDQRIIVDSQPPWLDIQANLWWSGSLLHSHDESGYHWLAVCGFGSNYLACTEFYPQAVEESTLRFLETLKIRGINRNRIVFLSVISRTELSGPGQVNLSTCNNRKQRFRERWKPRNHKLTSFENRT